MQVITKTESKMNFKDYYSFVDTIKEDLRSKIMEVLEISQKTFYNKLNADSWTKIELEKVEEIFQQHINSLKDKL
jgi:hypothetical protein